MVMNSASISPSHSPTPGPRANAPFPTLDHTLFTLVSYAFLAAIGLTIWGLTLTHRRKGRQHSSHIPPSYKSACQRCRYFDPGPYLKCAIHPTTVMTEASANCTDYWSSGST
jgi:hypothetical protein